MALENTHFGYEYIDSLIGNSPKKIFFDGIGGISMNSLARICAMRGHEVSGYDKTPSDITKALEKSGVRISYESSSALVKGCDALVYTVAMPNDDPAYNYAGETGIPRISRADFLGYVMSSYKSRIGVSGMHGKSTTTAICESIFTCAGVRPTVFGGAKMKKYGSSNVVGSEDYFIFEACEYMDSFLDFYPTVAIVLNIEMDHVDYFKSLEQIKDSFRSFMNKAKVAVINAGDKNALDAARDLSCKVVTYGIDCGADYSASNVVYKNGFSEFDITYKNNVLCHVNMSVPGRHMIIDALASAAAAHTEGIDADDIANGISSYSGICRRMDKIGKTVKGADVWDDYAHHPTEISTTLSGASELGYDMLRCVFQPHTFSRTAELFDSFVSSLAKSNLDEIIIAPIYSARETNTYGVSSEKLAEAISRTGARCKYIDSFEKIADYLSSVSEKNDAVFVVGAGDIDKVAKIMASFEKTDVIL